MDEVYPFEDLPNAEIMKYLTSPESLEEFDSWRDNALDQISKLQYLYISFFVDPMGAEYGANLIYRILESFVVAICHMSNMNPQHRYFCKYLTETTGINPKILHFPEHFDNPCKSKIYFI